MVYTVAKLNDKWVHIIKYAHEVEFSQEKDWFFICTDWEKPLHKREGWRWIPAYTRFDSIKELLGG